MTKWTFALTVAMLLMAGAVAVAQDARRAPSTGPSGYTWPRTFTGQPDFEFSKKEILEERAKQAEPQGLPPPLAPSLGSLMEDEKINPLAILTKTESSSTENVSGTTVIGKIVQESLPGLGLATLPSLTASVALDMGEFRQALRHAVRRAVASYQFQAGRYSLDHMLRGVTLQAVMTSPQRYAVLNNKQYREGESFPIVVWAGPTDMDLLDVMASLLPAEGSMTEAQAAQYQEVYEDMVREIAGQRLSNPRELQKQMVIPATVLAIRDRAVVVEFNGQRHELAIRFTY